ncbi:MAG: capsule biosynthesis protein [Planktomarina sp.]
MQNPPKRRFLLLQGPHGPYFARLGRMLKHADCDVWRVGFNAGDQRLWKDPSTFIPYTGNLDGWEAACTAIMDQKGITDIVLYGDTRPVHAAAVKLAKSKGITVHVFEEGYLRPFWVTYERGGSNGHSRLMETSVQTMSETLAKSNLDVPASPAHWGDMYAHVLWGAYYHFLILLFNRPYRAMTSHRDLPVRTEFWMSLKRILLTPFILGHRNRLTRRIIQSGYPYHIALLQLEHDSAFQNHSPFDTMPDFLEQVIRGFAEGAPKHHHLVFKAHPLESGRRPLRKIMESLAQQYGIKNRIHYVPGGKLAKILDHARTAVTVNSTAAQQVLWRGIPLKTFGASVYDKPEFASPLPIADFFAKPTRPDNLAYHDYRRYLLETSQVAGGFYSTQGRRQLLRQVVDMMLAPQDPYDSFEAGDLRPHVQSQTQHLRLIDK